MSDDEDIDDSKSFLDLIDDLITDGLGDEPILPFFTDFLDSDNETIVRSPRKWIRTRIQNRKNQTDEIEKSRENSNVRSRFIFDGSFCDSLAPSRREKREEKKRVKTNKQLDNNMKEIEKSRPQDLYY